MPESNQKIPLRALEEAAEWLLKLQDAPLSNLEQQTLLDWQQANTDNQAAWEKAQRLMHGMAQMPKDIAGPVLNRADDEGRRLAIGKLALLLAAGPTIWGGSKLVESQQWSADYRTTKGGFSSVTLPDGSTVKLNTATAFDIQFNPTHRLLTLREGEIEIVTAPVNSKQFGPFLVSTQEGELMPLGTRFTVRQHQEMTHLVVIEGRVKATPKQATQRQNNIIEAGQEVSFSRYQLHTRKALRPESTAWLQRMLAVHNMPLSTFINEVSRYRHGLLRVSPKLAELPISGSFPTTNTDTILTMLSHTYPLTVSRHLGGYWVTLEAS
ncbi:FecR family protein [Marinomonas arenicola]|uniref:FecR domain-containing protein n=1 Tax=Marinomonas TaxID=28253 RepID=UPI0010552F30|nr:FecR family protein [Marinomonas sp. KMM3893]